MASSYQDRLKARRGGGIEKKKPKELKLNATKRVRGKIHYWNPYTKSWSKTKVVKKVKQEKEKPLTRAEKLKQGMATWNTKKGNEADGADLPDSKMVRKDEGKDKENKVETNELKDKDPIPESEKQVYKPRKEAKVIKDKKNKESLKAGPKKYGNAPKGYIKKRKGKGFVSTKSVEGKRAAMRADRLKILQDKIKKKKEKK